jgi:hypothetical protein
MAGRGRCVRTHKAGRPWLNGETVLLVLGCLVIDQAAEPSGSLWASGTINIALAFWSTALTLNTLLTCLILIRIWLARKNLRSSMGGNHGKMYTSVAAMVSPLHSKQYTEHVITL